MKQRRIFCICLLLLCFLTACSVAETSFSVKMTANYGEHEPVMVTANGFRRFPI